MKSEGPTSRARPERDPARAIARAVLYEGYILWPYRRTATKNRQRWTFGGVHPRSWSEGGHGDDRWRMRTECLLRRSVDGPDEEPTVRVQVRFLQVVQRRVGRLAEGTLRFEDEVEVDGELHVSWDEALEREVVCPPIAVAQERSASIPIRVAAGSRREWIKDASGAAVGATVRSWRALEGRLVVASERVDSDLYRIRAEVENTTAWGGVDRDDALRSTFASTHLVLGAAGAGFLSLTDPPDARKKLASECRNDGCWPVLVGDPGATGTVMASPIILPDHPQIAPESPGDLFDGGEIDELLTLHILALTDDEKSQMRAADPRARAILERTDRLTRDDILALHGTFRDLGAGHPGAPSGSAEEGRENGRHDGNRPAGTRGEARKARRGNGAAPGEFWSKMEAPGSGETVVNGVAICRGSRVRLRPRKGGDVMDLALDGRSAVVEGVDEDDRGGVHLAVAIDGDPGQDLGMAGHPGHRFFFRPDEVEPLDPASPSVLVAGIGNIFLGDDGFGVEVVHRLDPDRFPGGVTVKDFGTRGMDLAYALGEHDVVLLIDAAPRGSPPGTLHLIDATGEGRDEVVGVETHGMDPARVLAFAGSLGPLPERVLILGCEPEFIPDPETEMSDRMSEPVRAAIDGAVAQVEGLVNELLGEASDGRSRDGRAEGAPGELVDAGDVGGRRRGPVHDGEGIAGDATLHEDEEDVGP